MDLEIIYNFPKTVSKTFVIYLVIVHILIGWVVIKRVSPVSIFGSLLSQFIRNTKNTWENVRKPQELNYKLIYLLGEDRIRF